jgi:hypothetical protein
LARDVRYDVPVVSRISLTDGRIMNTSQRSESPLVRFFDSFLQEKNIKWVLATGLLILLGSSLMMVTKGWTDFDPTAKFLVIMGYTTAIFVAGQWSYHHLALRRTGTVLMALTVLMIPATFVAWHWLWSSMESTASRGIACSLLALNTGLVAFAAQRTFLHFLRGNQTTFVVSFLLLSIAGAIAPALAEAEPIWSWLGAFGLWTVFSIGVIKVNRHVFWLTEEHRQPRIFGFFPIALLGSQFLIVFSANFAMHIPADWFGLACVLVAVPVLMTADSVARVFQERTGDIVRPIPWPIMLPLCVGLLLCASGVGLAASGLATGIPYAVVPTAALAAILMGVVARRTHRTAFVWAMLAGVLLTYNFSPVFFQELARAAIEQGAHAVNESKLPYAFYGLTYLPLIVGTLAAAVWAKWRGNEFFSQPLRQFAVGLSSLLLIVAFGHVKALCPVAVFMTAMFAIMTTVFGDRRLSVLGLTAFLVAAAGAVPFANSLWEFELPAESHYLVPLAAAFVLLLIGPWLDRRIRSLPLPGQFLANSELFQSPTLIFSLAATILTTAAWLLRIGMPTHDMMIWPAAIIGGLLIVHSLVWVRKTLNWGCVAFVLVEGIHCGLEANLTVWSLAQLLTITGLVMWVVTYIFERRPQWRVTRAWAEVGRLSALIVLALTTVGIALPVMAIETLDLLPFFSGVFWWPCYALLTVWCFDAARRMRQPVTAGIGCVSLIGFVSWTLVQVAGHDTIEWLPLAWVITAVAALPVIETLRRVITEMDNRIVTVEEYRAVQMIVVPTELIVRGLLIVLASVSLVVYDTPLMVAGGVALVGLVGWAIKRRESRMLLAVVLLANWLLIILAAQFVSHADHLAELILDLPTMAACLIAVSAATSTLGWQTASRYIPGWRDTATGQLVILRCVTGLGLMATLPQTVVLSQHIALSAIAFMIMACSEFWFACSRQDERRVWVGLAIFTAAFAYFVWFDLLHFGSGISMFLPLVVGGSLSLAATLARRHTQTEILASPFFMVGLRMPLMTVVIAIGRHFMQSDVVVWRGLNSLALLATSGFYFWHAIERHSKRFVVLSAAILNVALMLLFHELNLSDPQFYLIPIGVSILLLVEVLKREIPTVWHNPLRYAGALVILVSPTFHIIGDSWLPMLSLMISATAVLLVAIGLRVRALMYTGTAFLVADLVAMVVRGGIEHPNLLWITGIGFGAAVLTLGAVLENNREKMLQRLRSISSQLEQWT